jgi:hypothetical protein
VDKPITPAPTTTASYSLKDFPQPFPEFKGTTIVVIKFAPKKRALKGNIYLFQGTYENKLFTASTVML